MIGWIHKRYPADQGWIVLQEVANATGFARGFADAMALSMWPSRGVELHGFEFKASRTDLVKELGAKEKSERFTKFCDRWWLVVNDLKIIDGLEIPINWGILAPSKGALRKHRDAPKLAREVWSPAFVASIMRRCYEQTVSKDVSKRAEEIREQATIIAKKMVEDADSRKIKALERDLEQTKLTLDVNRKSIAEFEAASGIHFSPWMFGNIGQAVALLMNQDHRGKLRRELTKLRDVHVKTAASLRIAMIALSQLDERASRS